MNEQIKTRGGIREYDHILVKRPIKINHGRKLCIYRRLRLKSHIQLNSIITLCKTRPNKHMNKNYQSNTNLNSLCHTNTLVNMNNVETDNIHLTPSRKNNNNVNVTTLSSIHHVKNSHQLLLEPNHKHDSNIICILPVEIWTIIISNLKDDFYSYTFFFK